MQELLSGKNLACERDDRLLFSDLSFSLNCGDVLQIAGPNGTGKTTLLRMLAGLLPDYEGDIFFQGQAVLEDPELFRENLLYIGHQPGIKLNLTPEENLRWYQSLYRPASTEKIHEALAKVKLSGYEDVPCYTLSAGQHRRVALARLFLHPAPLWILDEPFTAIDQGGVREIEQLLADHARQGGGVILTTHHNLSLPAELKVINLGLSRQQKESFQEKNDQPDNDPLDAASLPSNDKGGEHV